MGTENVVQFLESTFSPNAESANVSSGSKLEKIKSADVNSLNTRDISQGSKKGYVVSAVDNKWSSSGSVSSVSKFTKASSNSDSGGNLFNISPSSNISEESNSLLSSLDSFN